MLKQKFNTREGEGSGGGGGGGRAGGRESTKRL